MSGTISFLIYTPLHVSVGIQYLFTCLLYKERLDLVPKLSTKNRDGKNKEHITTVPELPRPSMGY